ncbi:MAG: InlB B-repeat-containing protein [Lachnospiraceae bacterium]|jgi:prepilin-type N-terminal cleavage/methylation domain-containing protein
MKSRIKKIFNRKGMTLAELLVVIAIMAILGSLATVAVAQYRRNLKLYEMDNTAKEIFVAAQNRLSLMKVEDMLPETDSDQETNHYLIYDGNSASVLPAASETDGAKEIWDALLPYGAIDETVRVSGSYIISYDPVNAVIKDVFYSDQYTFSKDDFRTKSGISTFSDTLTDAETDTGARKRFNDSGKVIGYYGGEAAETVDVLHEPEISVINGDQLKAEVTLNEADRKRNDIGSVQLIVTLGNKKKILEPDSVDTATGKYEFLLDDVTSADASFTKKFSDTLQKAGNSYQLGADISIRAVVLPKKAAIDQASNQIISSGWSKTVTVNPLFADAAEVQNSTGSQGGSTAGSDYTASISSFRHLINLQTLNNYNSSTTGKLSLTSAKQISKMDWSDFLGNVSNSNYSYVPLSLSKDFTYDGQYNKIVNLKIGNADTSAAGSGTAAGLFGSVRDNLTLRNMVLVDFDVAGSNVGALVGEVTTAGSLNVRGVLACAYDNGRRIQGTENAGGLIGKIDGSDVSNISLSSASVYVEGGSNAGGLVGSASDVSIKDSYTGGHTKDGEYIQYRNGDDVRINVQATGENGIAGGLVGTITGNNSTVAASYSTASVYGSLPGTLIGSCADAGIEDSTVYGSGLTLDTNDQQVTALVGNGSAIEGYNYRSFVQGKRISYRYDAIENAKGTTTTIIGFALPGVQDLDSTLQQAATGTEADTLPYFISSHFGDWKILDQVEEKQIYYVDFYTYDESKLVPYTDDPMVDFVQPNLNINRQGVVEGESVLVPSEAPAGKYIESIDFYLTDTVVDNPEPENLVGKNTYNPNKAAGAQYSYADNNSGEDRTDFSSVNKNIIAIVNLAPATEISGRVQLMATFFDTDGSATTQAPQAIAYPQVVDGKVTPVEPVYLDYDFKGWFSDENCTTSVEEDDGEITVGELKTLYARYEKKSSTTKTVAFVLEVQGINGAQNTSLGTMLAHTDTNKLGEVKLRNYKNIKPAQLYRWDGSTWTNIDNPDFKYDTATLTLNDDLSSAVPYEDAKADAAYKILYTGDMVSYKVQYIFQNTDGTALKSTDYYKTSSDGKSYDMTQSVNNLPFSSEENSNFTIETEEATVSGMLATAKPLNFMEGDQGKFTLSTTEGNNTVLNKDDKNHIIKVYYTRNNYYLTYDFQSGIYNYTDKSGNTVRTGMKASELHMYGETFKLLDDDHNNNQEGYVQKQGYALAEGKEWYIVPDDSDDASKTYANLSADSNYPANLDSETLRSSAGFTMPAENVHVVANWQKNATASVTVEIFRQNVDHSKTDLYDYYTSFTDVGNFSTASDQSIQLSDVFNAIKGKTDAPTVSARFRTGDPDKGKYPSYDYYDFNQTKTAKLLPKEVSPDGSTVIRLYYDREKINYVFDYSDVGGVISDKEIEATVDPVTIYTLTVTQTETTQTYKYLQQGIKDGAELRYLTDTQVYYDKYYKAFYIGYSKVPKEYVVKYNGTRYELVDDNTDTSSGEFYYAPKVEKMNNQYYVGGYRINTERVYSVVSGERNIVKNTYTFDDKGTTYTKPEYGIDKWNYDNYGNKTYFGHSLNDKSNDNIYYFTSYDRDSIKEYSDSVSVIEWYLKNNKNTDHVEFDMPNKEIDWSKSGNGKLVYPVGSKVPKVKWTGLYEEPIANYPNYSWPNDYSWYYSERIGITFLAQFLPDPQYIDDANTITMYAKNDSRRNNLTINHYLQSDFKTLQDSDVSNSNVFISHFGDASKPVISQTTYASSFTLSNKYLGYSVFAYKYPKSNSQLQLGQNKKEVTTPYNNGTLNIYHKRNTYQIRVENTGVASVPELNELYEQKISNLDASIIEEIKENPPANLGTGYIFTGLYNSKGSEGAIVFDADGKFVGDATTYGVDTDNDGKVDAFQMPANNVQLFAHWEAPKVKVFFNLSDSVDNLKDLEACEEAVAGNDVQLVKGTSNLYKVTDDLYYVEMSQETAKLGSAVSAASSLTGNLTKTDSEGNTYKFEQWSTEKDSLREFISSSAVVSDFVLYPHWQQTAGIVRVRINVAGADGSSLLTELDKTSWAKNNATGIWTKDNWELDTKQNVLYWKGTMHTDDVIEAPQILGYTPYVSSQAIYDISPVSKAITFTYTSSQNVWTYRVNYVADFGSGTILTIKSETHSSENASEYVTANLNLDGYYLEGILGTDGTTVDPSAYKILTRSADGETIPSGDVPTVTFVYTVMKDEVFKLTGSSKLFDGTPCRAEVTYIGESNDLFAGLTKRTVLEYSEDGTTWTPDAPVDAGRYQISASVIFTDGNGKEYTVWTANSESSDQYVNIIPRTVFLESASYVFVQQDDQNAYRNTTVRVRGDGFLEGDGVTIQNRTAVPKGTSSTTPNNYFTYSFLTSDSKTEAYYERNYNVQRVFGTLIVKTELSDTDGEVNREWGTQGTEQNYPLP